MTRFFLTPALAVSLLAVGCAPAPLYTSSGLKRGAATWGEIPRDARGEPVWSAIRPSPGPMDAFQPDAFRQNGAAAGSSAGEGPGQGDGAARPTPPTA